MKYIYVFLMIIIGMRSFSIEAQDKLEVDMTELSLEELMDIKVTSASKKEESIHEAPSVITTISAKQIEQFGGNSVYDVLERAAGFYGLSSFMMRKNSFGLRGDLPNHINTHILYLINGRPFRESVKGGQNLVLLSTFPISTIKQIEIIRGPGSVLYGSNAYVGVVNIITKEAEESELNISGSGGTFGTVAVRMDGGTSVGDLKINGGINYFKTNGWQFSDSTRIRGSSRQYGETKMGEDALAASLRLNYKSISLDGFYGKNNIGHITPVTSVAGIYDAERIFLDLGFSDTIIPDLYSLSANITYNRINDQFDNGFYNSTSSNQTIKGDDYVFELTNFINVTEDFEITLGGSIYLLSGEQGAGTGFSIVSYNRQWFSSYLQADYRVNDWLKFVGGGQINKVENVDLSFVPRIAVIASSSKGYGAKVLYGQAFRAPYDTETNINALPTVVGDPDLVPENIASFETQLFYTGEKGSITLTYFNSNQKELINRVANTDTTVNAGLVYTNTGELRSQGLEFEGKLSIAKGVFIDGSYSFQTNKNDNDDEHVMRLPQHMFKLGVSYSYRDYINIGAFNSLYSSPFNSETAAPVEADLSAFSWLTTKLDININAISGLSYPKIGITAEGVNLLDQTVYNPEILFSDYNAVQNKPGMAIYFGVYVKF